MWAVVLMGGIEHGLSLSKMCEHMLCGLLEDGQRQYGMLRYGLCMCSMCSSSYQAITKQSLDFLMFKPTV